MLDEYRGGSRIPPEMTCGFLILIQPVFCKKKTMWFIGVEVEKEMSAPPPKKNPGSAPARLQNNNVHHAFSYISLRSLNDCDVKLPTFTFYGGHEQKTTIFFSLRT